MSDMKIEIDITPHQLVDMFVTAIEGGSTYWCQGLFKLTGPEPEVRPWYSAPNIWADPNTTIEVHYDDPDKPEGNGAGRKTLRVADLQTGVQAMADKYPSHFADWLLQESDADTGDCFLQCIVLGDCVYG